jgi:hypothetical protein
MSSHPHPHGELVNENVHHEERDINLRAVITFVVVLTVVSLAIQVAMYGLFVVFGRIETRSEPIVSPVAAPAAKPGDFSEPRLQTTPWTDLKQLRASEHAFLHGYGWVDQSAGIARIPIEKAKALLLQKGLPVRPDAVTDPTAGTHVAATGESSGGRNLVAGTPDKSSPAAAPSAAAAPVAPQPAPKGPGGAP